MTHGTAQNPSYDNPDLIKTVAACHVEKKKKKEKKKRKKKSGGGGGGGGNF